MLPMLTRRISEALVPFQIFYGAILLLSAASVPNADASEGWRIPLGIHLSHFILFRIHYAAERSDLQNRIPSSTSDLIIG